MPTVDDDADEAAEAPVATGDEDDNGETISSEDTTETPIERRRHAAATTELLADRSRPNKAEEAALGKSLAEQVVRMASADVDSHLPQHDVNARHGSRLEAARLAKAKWDIKQAKKHKREQQAAEEARKQAEIDKQFQEAKAQQEATATAEVKAADALLATSGSTRTPLCAIPSSSSP